MFRGFFNFLLLFYSANLLSQTSDSLKLNFVTRELIQVNVDSIFFGQVVFFIVNTEPSCTGCKYSIEAFIEKKKLEKKLKIVVLKENHQLISQSLREGYMNAIHTWKKSSAVLFFSSADTLFSNALWKENLFNKNSPFIIIRNKKGSYTFLNYQALFDSTKLSEKAEKYILKLIKT